MSDAPSKYEQPGTEPPVPPVLSPFQAPGTSATQRRLSQMNLAWPDWRTGFNRYSVPTEPVQQPDYRVPSGPDNL
jgi:hypothetical protein